MIGILITCRAERGLFSTIIDKLGDECAIIDWEKIPKIDAFFYEKRSDILKLSRDTFQYFENLLHLYDIKKLILLGDRWQAFCLGYCAHMMRMPIAHIHGGEETKDSYDNKLRHAISQLSDIHLVAGKPFEKKLKKWELENIYNVGSLGIEYILNNLQKITKTPFIEEPLADRIVLINYQPPTISGNWEKELKEIDRHLRTEKYSRKIFFLPNCDYGKEEISNWIYSHENCSYYIEMGYDTYLRYMYFADKLIGNSSSFIIEAPRLNNNIIIIGDRQKGRKSDYYWSDGNTSSEIVRILKEKHKWL